jgi:hypothetical protein
MLLPIRQLCVFDLGPVGSDGGEVLLAILADSLAEPIVDVLAHVREGPSKV